MAERKAKAAVVGVGLIGEQHANAYAEYPRSELVMVMDLNPTRAQTVGERFGVPWTTRIEDIARSDAEVVSVATPDFAHFEPVMTMLEAGKNVCVEKPLATITKEAMSMTKLARDKGLKLTINLGNRGNASIQNLRDCIQKGEIGEPVMAYSRCADTIWVPRKMLSWGGKSGPQWFLFAHTMDMVRWFLGQEALEVYAVGQKKILAAEGIPCYDAIQAVVKFEKSFCTFETSWILPEAWPAIVEFSFTMYGDKGRLHYNGTQQGFELSSDKYGKHMFARPALWDYFGLPYSWWEADRDLVNCVLDGGEPKIIAEDGIAVTAMIEATEKSIEEGRPIKPASLME